MPQTVPTKPYDWTYTTTYPGHQVFTADEESQSAATCSEIKWILADPENSTQTIPLAELTRPDPILFFAEVPLFEDELHDNGSSGLLVRIVCKVPCVNASWAENSTAGDANMHIHSITLHSSRR